MKVSEGLRNFLNAKKTVNNADLVDRWSIDMELQLNVAADGGQPVEGKRHTYDDGQFQYFNFRIPKDAAHEPHFRDWTLTWPFDLHAEGIGMTGWNWKLRKSMWVGFDFDAITGHAPGVGVGDDELGRVKQVAMSLPYIEVRKSTGGGGIHLYVYLEGIPTANHTEHAALARCILGMMSSETGFDFASQIDACGGNMWFWHRKMTVENEGLKILKKAEKTLSIEDLPPNWRDHVEVVTRRRSKIRVMAEMGDTEMDHFEVMASARRIVPLDDKHKEIIEELSHSGFSTVWVPDHHLLQTHTKALEKLCEDGKIKGIFKTLSKGDHPGTPNCFMFPMDKGAWHVYRFSEGVNEAETWRQNGEGWTNCYFNRRPDLLTVARAMGGLEDEKGGFVFTTLKDAKCAAAVLGEHLKIDDEYDRRKTVLKSHKDGRLVVEIDRLDDDSPLTGFVSKKGKFVRIYDAMTGGPDDGFLEECEMDSLVRHVETVEGDDAGWMVKKNGAWGREPCTHAKLALSGAGIPKGQAEQLLGWGVLKSWRLITLPFQPEYPGGRQWNFGAAQFRYQPVELDDGEAPHHPHWDLVFDHFFGSLTPILQTLDWAKKAGIRTGGDYGRRWAACLLRDPFEPLPYIFGYGPENSGKSILHESLSLLVTKGVVGADRALTTKGDFNGELANAILAVIEEKQVSKHPGAMNRIKEWVTARKLSIRRMRTDTYEQPSTLHFLQLSNFFHACPVFPGDTRITVVEVPDLCEKIPKKELLARLAEEAPHFMRTLMDLPLPVLHDRLRLPPIETADKKELAEEMTPLKRFLDERCEIKEGNRVIKKDLHHAYGNWAFENGYPALEIGEFGGQLMAVSKNQIRAKGQKKGKDGKMKHCYDGVCLLTNAV